MIPWREPISPAATGPLEPLLRWIVWSVILAAAALIRFHGLEVRSLWHDEAMSVVFSRLGPLELAERMRIDSTPPLYYLLLHAWTSLFGESVAALRALSAAEGLVLVAGIGASGSALFGERAGLAAAFVCAVSPGAIYFSQEARGYALLSLLVLLTWISLLSACERGKRGRWACYSVSSALALLVHNYAFFVVGAQVLWIAGRRDLRLAARSGGALAVAGFIYLPWLPVLLEQLANPTPTLWMENVWRANGPIGSLWATFRGLSPGGIYPDPIGTVAIATTGVVIGASLHGFTRRAATSGRASWLLSYLAGPLFFATLYSSIQTPVYVPGRLDQVVLPAFCLMWGIGLTSIGTRSLRLVAATVTFAAALLVTAAPRLVTPSPADREMAAEIAAHAEPGALVIATSLTRPTLEYYLRDRADLEIQSYPAKLARSLGNRDPAVLLEDRAGLTREAEAIAGLASQGRATWVAYAPEPINEPLLEALRSSENEAVVIDQRGVFRMSVLAQDVVLLHAERSSSIGKRRARNFGKNPAREAK